MEDKTIELYPHPSILMQSLRHIGYTLDTALADIIDNSIAAEAKNISIQYRWNNSCPWIAIIDDGYGMSPDGIHSAMRFGGDYGLLQSRNNKDLGRFGLGLKTASLSQCRRLTVISKQNDIFAVCIWDVDFLMQLSQAKWYALTPNIEDIRNKDSVVDELVTELEKKKSGTIVLWQNLDNLLEAENKESAEENFSEVMAQAYKHIGLVFHRFFVMENGEKAIKMDFNGTSVENRNPFGSSNPARQELQEERILIEGKDVLIQPFVLPHSSKVSKKEYEELGGDDGYLHNQGFYVYRNRRLIINGTWFRLLSKRELTKLLRIRIDIPNALDHLWQLDVKKSHAYPPIAVLNRLKEILPTLIDRGKRPYTWRGTRAISKMICLWRREFSNGKVSYVINDEHPLVHELVKDENGNVDNKKLSLLRIISGAFPTEAFRVDVNDDTKTEIVPVAQQEEIENAIRNLVASFRLIGLSDDEIRKSICTVEMPIKYDRIEQLIQETNNG